MLSPANQKPGEESRFSVIRIIAGCLLAAVVAAPALAQRAVILVRHAEKADASRDPLLSETGMKRAEALATLLSGAGISAIYCSEYRRTRLTAEPLAAVLKIPVRTFPAADSAGLVGRLRTAQADDVVLVVGHSNTLPELMRLYGHPDREIIADDDYGNVFVLVPREGKPPAVIRLRY